MMAAKAKPMPRIDNPILARMAQEEMLVAPERTEWFESCVRAVVTDDRAKLMLAEPTAERMADDNFWPAPGDWRAEVRPYVVKAGVLHIPVFGVLLNNFGYQFGRYATGYQYIDRAFHRGLADPDVTGIALIIDSPGGEVAGNFELVDRMYAARGQKQVRAFAAEHAYSAAYSIASAADTITMTRSGGVGSIGVVTAHVDLSGALEQAGVKVTFIYAGKHKVDGNPYEALPPAVKGRIQARIDKLYGVFVSTVARNRDMDQKAIRATEAATFDSDEALDVGLADSVGVFESALSAFADDLAAGDDEMAQQQAAEATVAQSAHETAVAQARTEGVAEGHKAGAKAERDRLGAILSCEHATGRQGLAVKMALTTDMSVEQVAGILAELPAEPKPAAAAEQKPAKDHFGEAMAKSGNPEVGAGAQTEDAEASQAERILADYRSVTGSTRKAS
jgi:signal peptide peptidase SppA